MEVRRTPRSGQPAHSAWMRLGAAEIARRFPAPARSRWLRAGLTPGAERAARVAAGPVLVLFAAGWTWSVATARAGGIAPGVTPATAAVAAGLSRREAPSAAYATQAVLDALVPLRGASGKLRVRIEPPGAAVVDSPLPAGARLEYQSAGRLDTTTAGRAPESSGIWSLAVRAGAVLQPLAGFRVITLHPLSEKRGGRVGLYYLGNWPSARQTGGRTAYAPPAGFIEVTPQNQDTRVSEHFRLGDFLTHDQRDVWPKYLVLSTTLLDKLELVLTDLAQRGVNVSGVRVMSGFRTPRYNVSGGDPSGRAALSRHMYGDAADIFIDSDHDGQMDDLDHNGRIDARDDRVILAAVERVERAHPELAGGTGTYPAADGHGPFIHIDTRGFGARWVGTGGD